MDVIQVSSKVLASKGSGSIWEGQKKSSAVFLKDLSGRTGKTKDAKLTGAGFIPKPCAVERAEMERMNQNKRIERFSES